MVTKDISHDDIIALFKGINELGKASQRLPIKFYHKLTMNRRRLHEAANDIQEVMNKIYEDWAEQEGE